MKAGLINVGANSDPRCLGAWGPIFGDGTFDYVPIPEGSPTKDSWTYGDLGIPLFDKDGKSLKDLAAHYDPEFETYTYGDYPLTFEDGRLNKDFRSLNKDDYIFFFAGLEYRDSRIKRKKWMADKGFYIIGYFRIKEVLKDLNPTMYTPAFKAKYGNNAHVRRGTSDGPRNWIYKGKNKNSALLKIAVPFNRSTVEKVLKTTADGSKFKWGSKSDFFRINSYTRNPRVISSRDQLDILW